MLKPSKLSRRQWILYSVILLKLILLLFAARTLPFELWAERSMAFAQAQGPFGVIVFAIVYVIATLVLFPCAILTVAAGMMYGYWGVPLVIFSAGVGASLAFLIARYFALDKVNRFLEKKPVTRALKKAVQEGGWQFMILLRVSPLIPFNLNNYLLGAAPVSFRSYLVATLASALPGTVLYIYLGTLGHGLTEQSTLKWAMFGVGLVATSVMATMAVQRTKRAMLEAP